MGKPKSTGAQCSLSDDELRLPKQAMNIPLELEDDSTNSALIDRAGKYVSSYSIGASTDSGNISEIHANKNIKGTKKHRTSMLEVTLDWQFCPLQLLRIAHVSGEGTAGPGGWVAGTAKEQN